MGELEQPLGPVEVAQLELAELDELAPSGSSSPGPAATAADRRI